MIKGNKNQLANVGNRFQGDAKKVLVVCSAGILRSPSIANALHVEFGYNTRPVGSDKEFALIPITQALIWWADIIVFVNVDSYLQLDEEEKEEIQSVGVKVIKLDIEDDFDYGDPRMEKESIRQFKEKLTSQQPNCY